VTGGNVSLYNENPNGAVYPTPVIGMVGLVRNPARIITPHFKEGGRDLWLLGRPPLSLGGSHYAMIQAGRPVGPCPRIDMHFEALLHKLVFSLIDNGAIETAQDLTEGGLFIAAAEGALGGSTGVMLAPGPDGVDPLIWLFSEDPSRILVSATAGSGRKIEEAARSLGIVAWRVGTTGSHSISQGDHFSIDLEQAREIYYDESSARR